MTCPLCKDKGAYMIEPPLNSGVSMQGPTLCVCTMEKIKRLRAALKPLVAIADAYDANNLDDEARKFWGKDLEHESTKPPGDIELYTGRGGKKLLTMAMCLAARTAMKETE